MLFPAQAMNLSPWRWEKLPFVVFYCSSYVLVFLALFLVRTKSVFEAYSLSEQDAQDMRVALRTIIVEAFACGVASAVLTPAAPAVFFIAVIVTVAACVAFSCWVFSRCTAVEETNCNPQDCNI